MIAVIVHDPTCQTPAFAMGRLGLCTCLEYYS